MRTANDNIYRAPSRRRQLVLAAVRLYRAADEEDGRLRRQGREDLGERALPALLARTRRDLVPEVQEEEEVAVKDNRAARRAQKARLRKFLSDIGVTPLVDEQTGDAVVAVEDVIAALGVDEREAQRLRDSAQAAGGRVIPRDRLRAQQ